MPPVLRTEAQANGGRAALQRQLDERKQRVASQAVLSNLRSQASGFNITLADPNKRSRLQRSKTKQLFFTGRPPIAGDFKSQAQFNQVNAAFKAREAAARSRFNRVKFLITAASEDKTEAQIRAQASSVGLSPREAVRTVRAIQRNPSQAQQALNVVNRVSGQRRFVGRVRKKRSVVAGQINGERTRARGEAGFGAQQDILTGRGVGAREGFSTRLPTPLPSSSFDPSSVRDVLAERTALDIERGIPETVAARDVFGKRGPAVGTTLKTREVGVAVRAAPSGVGGPAGPLDVTTAVPDVSDAAALTPFQLDLQSVLEQRRSASAKLKEERAKDIQDFRTLAREGIRKRRELGFDPFGSLLEGVSPRASEFFTNVEVGAATAPIVAPQIPFVIGEELAERALTEASDPVGAAAGFEERITDPTIVGPAVGRAFEPEELFVTAGAIGLGAAGRGKPSSGKAPTRSQVARQMKQQETLTTADILETRRGLTQRDVGLIEKGKPVSQVDITAETGVVTRGGGPLSFRGPRLDIVRTGGTGQIITTGSRAGVTGTRLTSAIDVGTKSILPRTGKGFGIFGPEGLKTTRGAGVTRTGDITLGQVSKTLETVRTPIGTRLLGIGETRLTPTGRGIRGATRARLKTLEQQQEAARRAFTDDITRPSRPTKQQQVQQTNLEKATGNIIKDIEKSASESVATATLATPTARPSPVTTGILTGPLIEPEPSVAPTFAPQRLEFQEPILDITAPRRTDFKTPSVSQIGALAPAIQAPRERTRDAIRLREKSLLALGVRSKQTARQRTAQLQKPTVTDLIIPDITTTPPTTTTQVRTQPVFQPFIPTGPAIGLFGKPKPPVGGGFGLPPSFGGIFPPRSKKKKPQRNFLDIPTPSFVGLSENVRTVREGIPDFATGVGIRGIPQDLFPQPRKRRVAKRKTKRKTSKRRRR